MSSLEELRNDNRALRERTAKLSTAMLRISESLDVEMVLHEIVESARTLTGARYGLIATIDPEGNMRNFVTSGLTAEEHRQMAEWPDGPRLLRYLRNLPAPLRVGNVSGFLESLGFSSSLWDTSTLQITPMYYHGEHLGNFFLSDKRDGGEFTGDDEEVLVLFASQAAVAIANARAYRDESRARADLEALVDASPVGVAVLDAGTGRAVSFNREAERIVEALCAPGQAPEDLLNTMTSRFPDGREIAIREASLARELRVGRRVRAEEIELSVPDGRSVRMLINTTPIRSEEGEVVSMVVAMQDLAPLEELERSRTEFLSLVSHELRAPLTSIKGSTTTVLTASPELDPAEQRAFFRIIDEQADHMRGLISDLLDTGRIETGTLSVTPEPSEVTKLVDLARKTFLSGGGRHSILVDLPTGLPPVMADRRRMVQVLNNLFANAARYSPESSPIQVGAVRDGVHIAISVADEGRGVEPERLPHLFRKYAPGGEEGATTGYGLGLAICKGLVEAHGGRIRVESGGPGQGTRFTFTVPVSEEDPADSGRRSDVKPQGGRERTRILVVDDDPHTLRLARDVLARAGYAPVLTGDLREMPEMIRAEEPGLVLLDLMLPGSDGIELMERLPELAGLPVIVISGYRRDETIARAFELGAADYLVKPFSPTELVARIRAALRRAAEPDEFESGDLRIRYNEREVSIGGRQVDLTATEFALLRALSLDAGNVVTTRSLLRQVWGRRGGGDSVRVRTYVKKLRRKLGDDAANPMYIFNKRSVGYRMANPDRARRSEERERPWV